MPTSHNLALQAALARHGRRVTLAEAATIATLWLFHYPHFAARETFILGEYFRTEQRA